MNESEKNQKKVTAAETPGIKEETLEEQELAASEKNPENAKPEEKTINVPEDAEAEEETADEKSEEEKTEAEESETETQAINAPEDAEAEEETADEQSEKEKAEAEESETGTQAANAPEDAEAEEETADEKSEKEKTEEEESETETQAANAPEDAEAEEETTGEKSEEEKAEAEESETETQAVNAPEDAEAEEETADEKSEKDKTEAEESETEKQVINAPEGAEAEKETADEQQAETAAAEAVVEDAETPFVVENIAAKGKKAALIVAGVLLGILLTAYVSGCIYFAGHFGFSTSVNGVDVSCASLDDAQNMIRDAFLNYRLTVEGKDGRSCELEVPDINMKVQLEDSVQDIRRQQNIFLWPVTFVEENALSVKCDVTYDEELLRECLYASQLFEPEGYKPSRDAQIIYDGKKITIEKEFYGNTLYKNKLVETVGQSLAQMETLLLLDDTDCYILPVVTSEDEELQKKYKILEPYSDVKLTYQLGIDTYEITPDMYMGAISYDENGSTWFDQNRLSALVHTAAQAINTAYSVRRFKTSTGKFVDVTGPYGYVMDEEQELISLCKMLRNKKSENREPIYSQEGFVRKSLEDDIGSTYVEVNLTAQHIYVYYEGRLYLESGIVTGNPNKGNRTPGGIYGVSYKQSPAVLRGRDYETPVTYWMPFNGGIGLHDATWQSSFGGKRYLYHGSHGCVNLPLSVAKKIYKICDKRMPVICYYENGEHPNGRKR